MGTIQMMHPGCLVGPQICLAADHLTVVEHAGDSLETHVISIQNRVYPAADWLVRLAALSQPSRPLISLMNQMASNFKPSNVHQHGFQVALKKYGRSTGLGFDLLLCNGSNGELR